MSFFDDLTRITRAHCAAQGLPTEAYDRALSHQERNGRLSRSERYGRLSMDELMRLPRIVALGRYGMDKLRRERCAARRERRLDRLAQGLYASAFHILVEKERAILEKSK